MEAAERRGAGDFRENYAAGICARGGKGVVWMMPSPTKKTTSSSTKAGRATARAANSKAGKKMHSLGAAAQTTRVQGHVAASVRRKQAKRDSR